MSAIKLASDSLIVTPAGGNIEYNGQFFATDSNNERAQLGRLVVGTSQASTSGTSIDFTGIPSWAKRITVMFNGVSLSGTSNYLFQLGDAGGIETTGYASYSCIFGASSLTNGGTVTTGFRAFSQAASSLTHGSVIFSNLSGNTWVAQGLFADSVNNNGTPVAGSKTLSDTLTQVRITSTGADTFDAGSINILYEG